MVGVFFGILEGESSLLIIDISFVRCFCMSVVAAWVSLNGSDGSSVLSTCSAKVEYF